MELNVSKGNFPEKANGIGDIHVAEFPETSDDFSYSWDNLPIVRNVPMNLDFSYFASVRYQFAVLPEFTYYITIITGTFVMAVTVIYTRQHGTAGR